MPIVYLNRETTAAASDTVDSAKSDSGEATVDT